MHRGCKCGVVLGRAGTRSGPKCAWTGHRCVNQLFMTSPRKSPSKRHRATVEGGSNQQLLPFENDFFLDVHAREDHLRKVGRNFTAPPTRTTHKSDEHWRTATSWAPLDDPNFALDPHDAWYNESVDTPIMQEPDPALEAAEQEKKPRSKVAVSSHQSTISFVIFIPHISEATSCCLEGELSIHFLRRDDTWCWSWRFSNRTMS